MKYLFFSILAILFIFSCSKEECGYEEYCPEISNDFDRMVPHRKDDKVVFVNSDGKELTFDVNSYVPSLGSNKSCEYDNVTEDCLCEECLPNTRFESFTNDTSRFFEVDGNKEIFNRMALSVNELYAGTGNSKFSVKFQLFNFSKDSIPVYPFEEKRYSEFYSEIELGGNTYANVIVLAADTNLKDAAYPWVWKVYMNKSNGIIAFYDLGTNSLYSLKNP